MSVTSKDVASRVGVSPSTVSRAFSRPELVDTVTRTKIMEAAKSLNYSPNRAASLLSGGRTGNLGVLVPDLNNPFFTAVLKGISAAANLAGMQLFVNDFNDQGETESEQARSLAKACDGLILCSSRMADEEILDINQRTPVVLVNRQLRGVSYIHFDNAGGIRQALLHLLALGHRRIGYCAGPALSRSAAERLRAYEAIVKSELDGDSYVLGEFASTFSGGSEAADEALNAGVTAVLTYNDAVAIGMVHRLLSYELELPAALSIIGFDNIPVSEMISPALTTVQLPQLEVGSLAVEAMSDRLRGGGPVEQEIASALVVRQSTARVQV